MLDSISRRDVLQLSSAGALLSFPGCAALKAELGMRTEQLGQVVLANSIEEQFEVEVEVRRNGTTVHESSHQLEPGSPEERPQVTLHEWKDGSKARSWEVRARTNTSEWRNAELDAAVGGSHDCHGVTIVTGDWPETSLLVLPGDCRSDLSEKLISR